MTTDDEAAKEASKQEVVDKSSVCNSPEINSQPSVSSDLSSSSSCDPSSNAESIKRSRIEPNLNEIKGDSQDHGTPAQAETDDVQMTSAESLSNLPNEDKPETPIEFTVIYFKEKHKISMAPSVTVAQLKTHLESTLGVASATAKLLFKVALSDDSTLEKCGLKNGAKVILMGTKSCDLIKVPVRPPTADVEETVAAVQVKEPLSKQLPHSKVIGKGKPDDAMVAMKNVKAPLPREPLSGMLNKFGGKVRLTFKLELDQVWIGTRERTEKVNMQSIRAIVSEPIDGHEEYHMLALQLGPTEQSRYWVYWVPAQYVAAIKDAILGN